jgi:hypothetical protein
MRPAVPRIKPSHSQEQDAAAPMRAVESAVPLSGKEVSFEQAAAAVLCDLQDALMELFAAAPSDIRRSADVERAFGINHLLGWQLYRIARSQNPLAAGMHVPARVSMKKLLTAAARRRISPDILERVSLAFDNFERFVETDAGNREELETMINAFLPEERRKQELSSKAAVFKGMSHIKGLAAEADAVAMFFTPSADGMRIDRVSLNCEFGLRRIRPDATIVLGSGDTRPLEKPIVTLDGRPADNPMGTLLPMFSSPLPPLKLVRTETMIDYCLAGNEVGMRSAVDIVMAERREGALPRHWKPNTPRYGGPAYTTTTPTKRMTLDAFVHEDVFPGVAPRLWVYDTAARGSVFPIDNPARQHDRLSVRDEIRVLPSGLRGARLPHAPKYLEIIGHISETMGFDGLARFRGYRLDVEYPIYGAEYIMGFEIPAPPAV